MGKVVRVGGRGTSRRIAEKEPDNWTGQAFKESVMKKRREAGKDLYITTGRGTKHIKFSDIPETKGRPSGKGRYVITGRGTSRRKVT